MRNLALKFFKADSNKNVRNISRKKADKTVTNLFKFKKLKNKKFKNLIYIRVIKKSIILIFGTKKILLYLK